MKKERKRKVLLQLEYEDLKMGAGNTKAAQTQKQAVQQALEKAMQEKQREMGNSQPGVQEPPESQQKPESNFQTIQGQGDVVDDDNAPEPESPMRNLFKQRQNESKYDDWLSKVDVNQKHKVQIPDKAPIAKQQSPNATAKEKAIWDPNARKKERLPKNETALSDGIQPLNFKKEEKPPKKALMRDTFRKKMELLDIKRLQKGAERLRAQTPDSAVQAVYSDVLENPLIVDYLKASHFFKDEMDEQGDDQYQEELKQANEMVSPLMWDSNTVVMNLFRVLQDLTPYTYDYEMNGEIGKFDELLGGGPLPNDDLNAAKQIPIGLKNSQLVGQNKQQFLGTLSGQGGKEFYNSRMLYDTALNENLQEPPVIQPQKQGKAMMTLRVDMKKTMTTAILKVPSGNHFDREMLMNQVQQWSSIPYHKRIARPLCISSLNDEVPLIFVEDVPFSMSLEDYILDRTFYRGYLYRFEIAHKILSCITQVIECLDHAHQNGVMHLNLHAGNILLAKCSQRDIQLGFFVTDFGDPLLLQEETQWNEVLEKIFVRLIRFYPPNMLSLIKQIASTSSIVKKREVMRTIAQAKNIMVDVYSVGVVLLFMITGGYNWASTMEIPDKFDMLLAKAESIVDQHSMRAIRSTLKSCLLLNPSDEPVDRIAELLPQLRAAKENCERVLIANSVSFIQYDKLVKPFYEYLPGQRKEQLFNQEIDILLSKDLSVYEKQLFQERLQAITVNAMNPEYNQLQKTGGKKMSKQSIPQVNDEDAESNILNNQAVIYYQSKSNYRGCVELFALKLSDKLQGNPIFYFNYLVQCWEAGVFNDEYLLSEITRVAINPYTGRSFSSFLFGILYEAQGNWQAAKVNYGLAYQSASDSILVDMHSRLENVKYYQDKYPEQFMFGHLEMGDVCDIVVSYHGKYGASFQKTSRIIVWNLESQKILKEIEDKNATCMDANAKLDRIVVGLRSGLIVVFNLFYEKDQIVNVDEVELGFHTATILVIKLSKDGVHGLSGGLDQYIALWNCQKKVLLSKIDLPSRFLRCACINMNGEDFMFAPAGTFDVIVYHHSLQKKSILQVQTLKRHKSQVTAVDISYDGLLGVTAGQDRKIFMWDILRGEAIREIDIQSFVSKVTLTPLGKFLSFTQIDGSVSLFETLTGINWRTEKIDGKHSGIAIGYNNYAMELCKEGQEHRMMAFLTNENDRLLKEFTDARGLPDSTYQPEYKEEPSPNNRSMSQGSASPKSPNKGTIIKNKTQSPMPVVPEADPEEESDYRRTTLRTTQRNEEMTASQKQRMAQQHQNANITQMDENDNKAHDVNQDEDMMLQDLFFENPVFKFFYFLNDEFTKRMSYQDYQQELSMLNFDRAKDPYAKNQYLLNNSMEQLEGTIGFTPYERGLQNYSILQERRKKFDMNTFRTSNQIQNIKSQQELCKLVLLAGETKRGENSEITQQGSIVGLRFQQISLPFLGIGPCLMLNHADQSRNIQVKIALKGKEMRDKGLEAWDKNNKEQAKYYLQRMRDHQQLTLNPSAIPVWAELQMENFKVGDIQSVYKIKSFDIKDKHSGTIEHIHFSKNEKYLAIMSNDFKTTFWEVGTWALFTDFRAYHASHQKFYLKDLTLEEIAQEFDVAVMAFNDGCNLHVNGLFNGVIQFWDIPKKEIILEIPSHLAEITALVFNYDCTILVSAASDYLINVWNSTTQQLMFEVREHLGPISYLNFVVDQNENEQMIEQLVSIDVEGYMIFVSTDGYIEKKLSVERQAQHVSENMDVLFSAYDIERELFLVRRNLNSSFYEYQKVKAGVEGHYSTNDCNSFPTIMKNKTEKRRPIDFLQVNQRGEFVCMAQKRDRQVTFRNSGTLMMEKRIELKEQIQLLTCGSQTPYMVIYTEKGIGLWMIEWDINS